MEDVNQGQREGMSGHYTIEARVYYQSVPPAVIEDFRQFEDEAVGLFLEEASTGGVTVPETVATSRLVVGHR